MLPSSLAGVVTGHPAKAEAWKKKYNLPDNNIYNYDNFDSIAGNPDIGLVYVVLPSSMHKEYTIRAAKAGKQVICEKPMAISSAECRDMIDACKNAGVQLAIGYRLHYEPYNLEMKRLGQEKVFGTVRYVEAGLGYKTINFESGNGGKEFDINDPSEWRLNKRWSGGGALMNLGVYCVQASRYMLGENPQEQRQTAFPRYQPTGSTVRWHRKAYSGEQTPARPHLRQRRAYRSLRDGGDLQGGEYRWPGGSGVRLIFA